MHGGCWVGLLFWHQTMESKGIVRRIFLPIKYIGIDQDLVVVSNNPDLDNVWDYFLTWDQIFELSQNGSVVVNKSQKRHKIL